MPCFASSSRRTVADLRRRTLADAALHFQHLGDALVVFRLQVAEGQVLELPLHVPDAEARGERRVYLHRLPGDAPLVFLLQRPERAHVVEAVGELDDDDAQVLRHRQEHLAQVLRLHLAVAGLRVRRLPGDEAELGDTLDHLRHLRPEALRDLGVADAAVFLDVVQQRAGDSRCVELKPGNGLGRAQRVDDDGLAVLPELPRVRLIREFERLADELLALLREVFGDPIEKLFAQFRFRGSHPN